MGLLNKILSNNDVFNEENTGNEFYDLSENESIVENDGGSKVILLEPRAYSEAQQIADHLKMRNTVLVNLQRVTSDQAKRIIDFLAGTIYAISGTIEKVGGGIFLCTPNNTSVQGKISGEDEDKNIHDNDDINIEW